MVNDSFHPRDKQKKNKLRNSIPVSIHDQFNLKINKDKNTDAAYPQYHELLNQQASMFT